MGQALFLLVFVALLAVGTAWSANDLRVRGEVSELAELVLRLLAVLGAGVFLLAVSSSTWATDVTALVRLPLAGVLALAGVASVFSAGRSGAPDGGRSRVLGGFLLVGAAAALVGDSAVSLLLVAVAGLVTWVLTAASRGAPPVDGPRGERWTSRAPSGTPMDVQ